MVNGQQTTVNRQQSMVNGQWGRVNGQPTPNRAQLSLLELPRCEGGKDHEVGLTDNGQQSTDNGQQTTVNSQWSMVNGQQTTGKGQQSKVMVNGEGITGIAFRMATL